jgi:hypothetical protein
MFLEQHQIGEPIGFGTDVRPIAFGTELLPWVPAQFRIFSGGN